MSTDRMSTGKLVIRALQEHGPMTTLELADVLDMPMVNVNVVLTRLRRANSQRPQLVYVKAWKLDEGAGSTKICRENRVYALGNKRDAPRPASTKYKRYAEKRRALWKSNPFAGTRDQWREQLRKS